MITRARVRLAAIIVTAGLATIATAADSDLGPFWLPATVEAQLELERALNVVPDADELRRLHEIMCAEPHVAGSAADQRMIEKLSELFKSYGLPVQLHTIHPLLANPVSASVTIETVREFPDGIRTMRQVYDQIELSVREPVFEQDKYSSNEELTIGWNAYSGSGSATGEVVYANYGTKDDFDTLRELGIRVRGRIVLARYGGNFRGFKAKFAQEAGAIGLLIYTDPADSGYKRGPEYPDGGWAHGGYIQNGSIKTLGYPGDPLTPNVDATVDVPRLDESELALPKIPVQPIGWDAAHEIMKRMNGQTLPREIRQSWQGGLPLAYRLTGGRSWQVRMNVQQTREIMRTSNVLGIVEGSKYPDQVVIVGCHFDAWTFGAGDPHAGSIVLMEMARSFSEAARNGHRPARTVIFANWAAEEFGIIGSTEWVEANREHLLEHAVAYINLDMAAMGPNFRASSSPSLKRVIADAARATPQANSDNGQTVFESWSGITSEEPSYGTLGGGSDHVGFYCHAGVPSCGLGARGSDGVSYHSNSDNLMWYRQVVGNDYESALMLTRLGNIMVARLANADLVPLDPTRYAPDMREHVMTLSEKARKQNVTFAASELNEAIDLYEEMAQATMRSVEMAVERSDIDEQVLAEINQVLISLERCWLREEGIDGRPWYRNQFAATDPFSGYGAWVLPGLRGAIHSEDQSGIAAEIEACRLVFEALTEQIRIIGSLLPPIEGANSR